MKKNISAIKRTKQAEQRRVRNSHVKSTMKTALKKALSGLSLEDQEQRKDLFRKAVSEVYGASSKGVIHRNAAARKVARLSKKMDAVAEKVN